jgi:hypothetical protein
MSKIKSISSGVFLIATIVASLVVNPLITTAATVTGNNTLVSYTHNQTSTASFSGMNGKLSEDGNTVVFASDGTGFVSGTVIAGTKLYKRNISNGMTSIESVDYNGNPQTALASGFAISRTARYIAFMRSGTDVVSSPAVTANTHAYIRDTVSGTNTLVDQSSTGTVGNRSVEKIAGVSDDGRFVVFQTNSYNLLASGNPSSTAPSQLYQKDMQTGQVTLLTKSNAGVMSNHASLVGIVQSSCDGMLTTFAVSATNLTPDDTGQVDTYLIDTRNGHSITNITHAANADARPYSISCNGRYLTMMSAATNITADSVTGTISHGFRYDRLEDKFALIDKTYTGAVSTVEHGGGPVSDNGLVAMRSNDKNLTPTTVTTTPELVVFDPDEGTVNLVAIDSTGTFIGLYGGGGISGAIFTEMNSRGDRVLYVATSANLLSGLGSGTGRKMIVGEIE